MAGSTQKIHYYGEAGQLISVTDGSGNPQREYIYLDNQPLAFIANQTIYYIHTDHLNTPQVVTDQNQQVVWMGDYQPFGKLTDNTNQTNSVELYSRFPGQYLDSETGLYYNYFRDYDPSIGRYIQSDPIGLQGGINTYAYVEGNPLSYTDSLGLRRGGPYGLGNGPYGQTNMVINLSKEPMLTECQKCHLRIQMICLPVSFGTGRAGVVTGGAVGFVFPGVGNATGATVGAVAGGVGGMVICNEMKSSACDNLCNECRIPQ